MRVSPCSSLTLIIGKSGYVKEDLFFQLLHLHGVELSPEARAVVIAGHKKGDKINYKDALVVICVDLETAGLAQEQKWTVRKEGTRVSDTISVRSTTSRAKSYGQPV